MFLEKDLKQIADKGISREVLDFQLEKFKTGYPFTVIDRAATLEEGILAPADEEIDKLIAFYEAHSAGLKIVRFIPASGAATRMFKSIFSMYEKIRKKPSAEQESIIRRDTELSEFFDDLDEYPFIDDLQLEGGESYEEVLDRILNKKGLSYGSKPKGLLKFHHYGKHSRTPFEEHLREAAAYCACDGKVSLHFTVSPEHLEGFQHLQKEIQAKLEKELKLKFQVSYSFQKEETDTIAVDMDNKPFRDKKGEIVFRPGGHGALLENLNEISADIIFISNIDNVAPDRMKEDRIACKKYLGGVLLQNREKVFNYLKSLKTGDADEGRRREVAAWIEQALNLDLPSDLFEQDEQQQADWLISQLDRPLRVCGMVKNEGEPGGGPFFVKEKSGRISLQIVEPSQIDQEDPDQREILHGSTHFNPVDLACSFSNEKGEKYDLMKYRDPDTGFITIKSMEGRDLKAQELPGLWNGSMARWNTIFVEVPIVSFTPVKTVFDLTREEHRTSHLLDDKS